MEDVFIGSAALAGKTMSRGQLRWNYRAMFPDVYTAKESTPQLAQRTVGAWLWSKRQGVIAGIAAAALHGAQGVDQEATVELIWRGGRSPRGITIRNERIRPDEITRIAGLPVTTPERTALDLARHLPRHCAVIHLDALARATGITASDVQPLVDRYHGTRAIRPAIEAVALMDSGSQSPGETMTRLALIDAGFPRPRTDFTLTADGSVTRVAVGYDAAKVGVVFGADDTVQHEKAGWHLIPNADAPPLAIMVRVRMSVIERGYPLWRLQQLSRA